MNHEERKLGIGGSDMPIILGLSSYKTPYELFLEKTGVVEIDEIKTPQQEWGLRLEDAIAQKFEEIHNTKAYKVESAVIHPEYKFLRGNVDRVLPELNSVLEIKCSNSWMKDSWGEPGSDFIPMPYLVQIAHYCNILNADRGYIAVLIGGNDYREYVYERDYALESSLVQKAKEFWDCVQSNTPPEPVNINDLKIKYSKPEPSKIEADDVIISEFNNLKMISKSIKVLEKKEEEHKFELMKFMETNESLIMPNGIELATWKADKNGKRRFVTKNADFE